MEIKEEWKDVIGYEGLYQCSNLGRVKSLGNGKSGNSKERVLKQEITKNGYYRCNLSKDGKIKHYSTHRLIAQAFIPNPQNLPQVNHKDENPSNNCVNNLEWCTAKYNMNYGTRNERASKANSIAQKGKKLSQETKDKLSKALKGKPKIAVSIALKGIKQSQEHIENRAKARQKPIACYNKNGNLVALYTSAKQASELLNINNKNINACCRGNLKSCGGYIFKYIKKVS